MRYVGLLIITFSLALPVYSDSKEIFFEQISSDVGFSFNAITSIIEDKHGFVWFGSNEGVFFYNTVRIKKYSYDPKNDNSLPSNIITKLYKDKNDIIWVCTQNGICYFDEISDSFIRLKLIYDRNYLNAEAVSSIVQYSNDEYLIILNSQLYHFNINDPLLRKISIGDAADDISYLGRNEDNIIYVGTKTGKVFINNDIISEFSLIYSSSSLSIRTLSHINNQLWIASTDNGIDIISTEGELITQYREEYSGNRHIPSNIVRKIIKRKNGEIWIGTYDGITIIDGLKNRIVRHDPYNGLPHNSIYELYIDRKEGIWIGTWSGGLAYYSDYNYRFSHISLIKNNVPISNSVISSFLENKNGNIIVGSETNGLFTFNPHEKAFVNNAVIYENLPIYRIKSIAKDKDGRRWIGTFMEGLWYSDKQGIRMVKGELDKDIISSLLPVDSGIWVGTREHGLKFVNKYNGDVEEFIAEEDKIGTISSNRIWDIFQDSKENIWICTDFGLNVNYKNENKFTRYFNNANINSLSQNLIFSITEDRHGKIWIGTNSGGIDIFDPETKTFQKFRLNEDIKNADVYSFVNDLNGNIWFSTNQGLYVYYTKTNTLERFTEKDGLSGLRFQPNSGFINSSGKIFFGGPNGFNMIDPDAVKKNPVEPDVFLSELYIHNQPFNEEEVRFINSKFAAGIERLEIAYNKNSIGFEFAANNFIKNTKNQFRYRMKNYIDEWIDVEHGNYISFTKIPPGNYTLQVLASNNDGVWSEAPREIQIKIYPPVWGAWYSYIIYFLIVSTVVLYTIISRRRAISERFKHTADEVLFSEKVKFFTNISHEFRTPLTLILSPVEHLMNNHSHYPDLMEHIKVIKRNADRLLRLTNQIMDFRLIELDKVKLKQEKTEIVSLFKNVYDCFEYQISEKHINCVFTSSYKSFFLKIDSEKIEKVIYNILSNALKHSHEKGQILLSLEPKILIEESYSNIFFVGNRFLGKSIEIKVKDNGKGIKAELLPHIFNRFVTNEEGESQGSGIGLHICQEFIQLHGGNIMVVSELGNGTTFSINIPITDDVNFDQETVVVQYHFDPIQETKEDLSARENSADKDKIILFAEDNDELRIYFKNILSARFKVITAKNGQQAFEIAQEVIPDVIISDILMPGMGGIELTRKIRETKKTRQIPIILLTALSDDKSKIESLHSGADDFITKPVEKDYLFAKIENILNKIESLRQSYEEINDESYLSSSAQEPFIQKVERIILSNLQNPAFEIEDLASMLNLSRSSLHRKLKNKINMSPSEFVRDIRLIKAVKLIKEGNLNMDEIGFVVGFNSQSYFIRSFKAKYGKTPSAFKNEKSDDT